MVHGELNLFTLLVICVSVFTFDTTVTVALTNELKFCIFFLGEANYKLSSLTREVNKFLHQFDKTVTFESEHALKKLEELGLINATQIGKLKESINWLMHNFSQLTQRLCSNIT